MKWFKRILIAVLIILIAVAAIIIGSGYSLYAKSIQEISLADKISQIQQHQHYTKLEDLPEYYAKAVVAVEDRRFYEHGPIDFIAIGRAIVSNIKQGELAEGGSTITQQVAKNLYFMTEDSVVDRKIAEIFMAFDLEKNYSKNDILELYINTIFYGYNCYNIYDASQEYYDKEPKDLTLYEATLLAGVPNAPSVYSPKTNITLAHKRQEKVLSSMVKEEYLSQEEADKVILEQQDHLDD
ncbi:MAG: transglycosylase domain-containing protein [Clostridia bacterium]|jgi:penicillin-binding protein, 1A family